ncbi:MAG: GAF domain-containing protein [Gilvibacter sp.]
MNFEAVQKTVSHILENNSLVVAERLNQVCECLRTSNDYYTWVGFYFAVPEKRELHLKAFAGIPTDHTVIPFGKGICGQVAESNQNFVVPDVAAQDNYIACSIHVKAEIVVPLFKDGINIGQIDIDSNTPDPFSEKDEQFLTWVNTQVAKIL